MPVSRDLADGLAENLRDLYAGLEQRLAGSIARELHRDPDPNDLAKLDAISRMRGHAHNLVRQLDSDMRDEALAAVTTAYARGARAGLTEIASTRDPADRAWWERRGFILKALARLLGIAQRQTRQRRNRLETELDRLRNQLPGIDAIQVLAHKLSSNLADTHLRVLRWPEDSYRRVVAESSVDVLAGTATRRRAAQVAWEKLLAEGITGFTDRSGRRWQLTSYVEMATRTTTAQAAVEAHLERLTDAGLDLVIVSDAPQECVICRPWEGKVLSVSGTAGPRTVEHTLTGQAITITVAATVAAAILAGLQHPNCRHSLSAYLPGVTKAPTNTADPDGDAARQRLRAMERHVREWKRRDAGAITHEARLRARAKVKRWQAEIRDHIEATGLIRQRHREQVPDDGTPARVLPPTDPVPDKQQPPLDGVEEHLTEEQARSIPLETPEPEPDRLSIRDGPAVGDLVIDDIDDLDRSDHQTIKDAANRVLDRDFAGYRAEVITVGVSDDETNLYGNVFDDNGAEVGRFQRDLHRDTDGTLWVEHAFLRLDRRHQGQGFAKAFNDHLYDWYRDSGVERVEVHANIDVGGYTWGRQGFDFADDGDADEILERLREQLGEYKRDLLDQQDLLDMATSDDDTTVIHTEVERLEASITAAEAILDQADRTGFGDDDYPTAYEMSQCGRVQGEQSWIGKTAMLGSSWHGVRWM